LDGLVKFKANTKHWKLEFEREAIQDETITFDDQQGTLTISNIPAEVLAELIKEFRVHANTTDTTDNIGATL
jgi:nucleoid-associated protein